MKLRFLRPSRIHAIAWLALLASAVVFWIAYRRLWPFAADDAFISTRYARHLAEGAGLVFNRGERVEGYTNFLWTVLLAVPFLLGWGLVPFLKVAAAIFAVATALVVHALGAAILPPDDDRARPLLTVLAPALFLSTPGIVLSAAEGLETMMFTFLLSLTLLAFLKEQPDGFPWSAVAVSALAMTRPDGAAFAPVLLLAAIHQRRPRASWSTGGAIPRPFPLTSEAE